MQGAAGAFTRIVAAPFAVFLTRTYFGLETRGARHLPRQGPALIVSNHQGYLDPLFLQMGTARTIHYLMTSVFYDRPAARPLFRLLGAIRVPLRGPHRDALRQALRILDRGGLVGVFPEGQLSRDGEIGTIMPGAALLASRSGVPVVPAQIRGSFDALSKGRWLPRPARVRVRYGPPLRLSGRRGEAMEEVLSAWRALVS
jgi:1-acyl-sn-glycerol-3-phosphate acyltransferase